MKNIPILLFVLTKFSVLGQQTNNYAHPLFVINGKKIISSEALPILINPQHIENVDVIKAKDATKKYGSLAENGVIEINLKLNIKLLNFRRLKKEFSIRKGDNFSRVFVDYQEIKKENWSSIFAEKSTIKKMEILDTLNTNILIIRSIFNISKPDTTGKIIRIR